MEFSFSADALTIVSDKKTIIIDATTSLEVDGMTIELPGEYEKSGFLIQSRYLRAPFDPIAVAHKELQKQMKQKQAEELEGHDEADVEGELVSDSSEMEMTTQEVASASSEETTAVDAMIHSLNIEGYNILLLCGDISSKTLRDEHFASFIKKVDLIATDGGEGSLELIRLVEPRITLVYGSRAESVSTKLGKTVEPVSKWKSRESDFQSDEEVVIALMD